MKTKDLKSQILLPNGCKCSALSVFPETWKLKGKFDHTIEWRIGYYFYDGNGARKYVIVKKLHRFKYWEYRYTECLRMIDRIHEQLKNGYNPISKKYFSESMSTIYPEMFFINAFKETAKLINGNKEHVYEVNRVIGKLNECVPKCGFGDLKIKDFKKLHLKLLLNALKLSDNSFNKYLSYISILLNELVEYECIEHNFTKDIKKKKISVSKKLVLTAEEFIKVNNYLKEHDRYFYLYFNIFYYSGARSAELLRLKKKDVNLTNQEYNILLLKGVTKKQTTKVILKQSLEFWEEALGNCTSNNDYIFSTSFTRGDHEIDPKYICKKWNKLKVKLDIKANFYSLKHLFLDNVDSKMGGDISSNMASHTSTNITNKVYLVSKEKRERDKLKDLEI